MITTLTPQQAQNLLTDLKPGDKIEIVKLPTGEIRVSDNGTPQKTKEQIIQEKYGNLVGQPITVSDAAEKYGISSRVTIHNWAKKGYITIIEPGYQMTLDEADVAYCASIYKQKKESGLGYRGPLLDEHGLPYELKRPKLATYRRRKSRA